MEREPYIAKLRADFPEAPIACIPEDEPQEIIAVLGIVDEEPRAGIAVAFIERSRPHYHKTVTEVYTVERGTLTVYLDGKPHRLRYGENLIIHPGVVHWAEASPPALVWVASTPPWTAEDHVLVAEEDQ